MSRPHAPRHPPRRPAAARRLIAAALLVSLTAIVNCRGPDAVAHSNPPSDGPPEESPGADTTIVADPNECAAPQPAWIWCDDFETDRLDRYFEITSPDSSFTRQADVGFGGSAGMRAHFTTGRVDAGSLKLAFGRTPNPYFKPADAGTADYRELYWRLYLRHQPGWVGDGADKLSRATIFPRPNNWAQAMVAHVWSGGPGNQHLVLDPASGTDAQGTLRTNGYNDFSNFRWLGAVTGSTPIFDATRVGEWYCIEARVRLNDAGASNGVFELWIDDTLDARKTDLNWIGAFSDYGINALFIENFWNDGSPVAQSRYMDRLVVSTQRIGC